MDNSYEEILLNIMQEYEKDPEQDLDALLERKCKEYGLSEEGVALVKETNELVDDFAKKRESLALAEKKGESRAGWFRNLLDKLLGKRTEEEKQSFEQILKESVEKSYNDTLTEEEE